MLVNLNPFGRLGNRLFLDAHLSAFCWKYGVDLQSPALGADAEGFPAIRSARPNELGLRVRSFLPGAQHFRYWGEENLDFDRDPPQELIELLRCGKTVFFHGWKFRGFESVRRFRPQTLEKYRPDQSVLDWAAAQVATAQQKGSVVVGVHVRWEDYRGTPYFLSLEDYLARMKAVSDLLAPQTVSFLVFSNESLNHSSFDGLPVGIPSGQPLQDLQTMAACDYLMAPPSTFSGWASFYGEVPLLSLMQETTTVALDDFHVVQG